MWMSGNSSGSNSLFSDERVPLSTTDRWTQTDYQRLDQATSKIADRVRSLMDEWFRSLPAHAQPENRQRFMSPSLGAHLGAFWEMYQHEAARRLCFDVDIDVGREHGRRRPDLLVNGKAASFFLEATVALGDAAVCRDQRARADQLYAAIERVRNRDFLLHTDLMKVGEGTPGRKLVADPIDRWLATLDPDAVRQHADSRGAAPAITINKDGWRVRIEATGKRVELRGDQEMGVIGSLVEGFDEDAGDDDLYRKIDDVSPLTNVLLKKAGHGYELGDRPFVISVLCAGDFIDEHDIAQALFGRIDYRLSMSSDRAGPRYTRVSAVLTASNLHPGAVAAAEPCLWLNPAAVHPVDVTSLPWRRWEIEPSGRLIEHPANTSAAELFGLSARWPADEPDRDGPPQS
jgi:hypothetical protein